MPLFKYRAVDQEGNPVEGTMDEASARRVTAILAERGLQVNSVEEVEKRLGFLRMKSRLTWEDLDLFNEQLLAITKSGLPLAPSLRALAHDLRNPKLKAIFEDIRSQIESGNSLEEALSKYPESFSPVYRSIVKAGEQTGNLSGVLSQLSTYSARLVEVKNRLQEAVAYPMLILVASCVVLGLLIGKIVPEFASMYEEFGAELPPLTNFWLATGKLLQSHPVLSIGGFVVVVLGLYWVLRTSLSTEVGGYKLDWIKLHFPIFRKLYFSSSVARFSRSFGLMLTSRIPVVESMDLASAAAGNAVLRAAVVAAAKLVTGGERISDALANTGFFEHSFCWTLATAEGRGEVDRALLDLAESYERRLERLDTRTLLFLGPVMIIIVGLIVASVVIAMYMPLFSLADQLSGP